MTIVRERIQRLRLRLTEELPGPQAQLRMAPGYRMSLDQVSVEGKVCREAGVLIVLYPEEDALNLLLTLRPDHMTVHAGQISFPGGRREGSESLLTTALREAEEEVGLQRGDIEVLGSLTPLFIPPSNFCVHPFVAFAPSAPEFRPQDAEVHALLHLSIDDLFHPDSRTREVWHLRGVDVEVPFYRYRAYQIWGATAMMLSELDAVWSEVIRPEL